jgi:hypothetical protein
VHPLEARPPDDVVLERRTEDGEDLHADRVCADGSVWRQTTVRAHFDASGALMLDRGPANWERLGSLDGHALGSLRAAILASGADDLPDEVLPEMAAIGGVDVAWTIPGRVIVARGAPAASDPALEHLSTALDAALAAVQR